MTPQAYYNEFDPHAAAWLRELIKAGLIMPGHVDERSIHDVTASDLDGFTRVHFFAGIGGWDRALQLAGWRDGEPVWTGSCPCQPFALGGHNKGTDDHRDLWPVFARLIAESKPAIIFGEQVKDAIRWGWLDRLCDDLETEDYAVGSTVLPASAIRAIQDRDRLWWVARSNAAPLHGQPHDRMGSSRTRGASVEPRGLLGLQVVGGRWTADYWPERQPTLVRNFDGLSTLLGGFGNAIVPQVAAEFIQAYCEVTGSLPSGEGSHPETQTTEGAI